jgi:uncharacterized membrane protein
VAATVWVAAVFLAPGGLGHSGSLAAAFVYEIGALVCHQRPERSFHLAGVPMPVCARCVGLYGSAALGALVAWASSPRTAPLLDPRARLIFVLVAAPTALSAAAEWLTLVHPSGAARAILGLPLGVYLGWACVRSLRAPTVASGLAAEMRYHS